MDELLTTFQPYLPFAAGGLLLILLVVILLKRRRRGAEEGDSKPAKAAKVSKKKSKTEEAPEAVPGFLKGAESGLETTTLQAIKAKPEPAQEELFANTYGFLPEVLERNRVNTGKRCEHTDEKTRDRCKGKWVAGEQFYPNGMGGSFGEANILGACKWHSSIKNDKLKDRNIEKEREVIEERRRNYFPAGAAIKLGEFYPAGLRITFSLGEELYRLESADPVELVSDAKVILRSHLGDRQVPIEPWTPASLVSFLENLEGGTIESFERADPNSVTWVALRPSTPWARKHRDENPEDAFMS